MLALQVVAGALLLAGSLALVAFLRWLEAQEPEAARAHAQLHPVGRPRAAGRRPQTLKRAA